MTATVMKINSGSILGRIEKTGLIVTGIIALVNLLLGSPEIALGVVAGGILATVNFFTIKLVVRAIVSNLYSKGFSIFIIMVKLAILIAIVISLFVFTRLNIYGFLIGIMGVLIVIIGESLRGAKNGTL
ncbi:MAG: hypothetical protein KatS3mg078_1454 [Deltaproteobacteria bacterium]|jgi:hypothetical protein|nr:MAG: hypothetical protein KatS3mg078_1454 [Deltaproteobacteria bacterium]